MTTEDFIKLHEELSTKIMEKVESSVESSVDKYVNGKINKLTEKVDNYIREDTTWKKEDQKWKETAQPSVNLGISAINLSKMIKWIVGIGIGLAGFIGAINVINTLFQ